MICSGDSYNKDIKSNIMFRCECSVVNVSYIKAVCVLIMSSICFEKERLIIS